MKYIIPYFYEEVGSHSSSFTGLTTLFQPTYPSGVATAVKGFINRTLTKDPAQRDKAVSERIKEDSFFSSESCKHALVGWRTNKFSNRMHLLL